jgi:hypothetical protein
MQKKSLTNSTSLHDKNPEESRNGRNTPQYNRGYIRHSYSQHHTKKGKTETISSKVKNETRSPVSPLLFNIMPEFLAKAIR